MKFPPNDLLVLVPRDVLNMPDVDPMLSAGEA